MKRLSPAIFLVLAALPSLATAQVELKLGRGGGGLAKQ